jgi:hypothetical protein
MRARPASQHHGEPLPAGDDPALDHFAIVRQHAQLTLAFVQIKPYRIHGGWPPVLLRRYDRV